MINSIGNFISHPAFICTVSVCAAVAIIKKIAIPLLKKLGTLILYSVNYMRDSAIYVNLKSLFCVRCANVHKFHIIAEIEEKNKENQTPAPMNPTLNFTLIGQ
jgi:hypothetical protein